VELNGESGALTLDRDGKLISVITIEVAEGRVQAVNSLVNPEKLRHLGPVGDMRALLEESKKR
jgi:RNA polymerase sigma-70 factor (ECF subfamily)